MLKRLIAFVSGVGLLLTLMAVPALAEGRQYLEVGIGYSKFDYSESIDGGPDVQESGWLPGVVFGYTYKGEDNPVFASFSIRYTTGQTNYDGALQDGTPWKDKSDNTMFSLEVKFGYILGRSAASRLTITPYAGIGYYDWERKLGGPSPYIEEYSWFYFPVGVRFDYDATPDFTIGLDLSARVMFNGSMNVKFSDLGLSSPNLDLGNRIGFRAELPMDYRFHPQISVGLTPWYQYTTIGRSGAEPVTAVSESGTTYPVMTIYEPNSNTHQYGADLTVRFWF